MNFPESRRPNWLIPSLVVLGLLSVLNGLLSGANTLHMYGSAIMFVSFSFILLTGYVFPEVYKRFALIMVLWFFVVNFYFLYDGLISFIVVVLFTVLAVMRTVRELTRVDLYLP